MGLESDIEYMKERFITMEISIHRVEKLLTQLLEKEQPKDTKRKED